MRRGRGIGVGSGRRQLICLVEGGGVPSSSADEPAPESNEERRRAPREPVARFNEVFALRRRGGPGRAGSTEMEVRFRGGGLLEGGPRSTVNSRENWSELGAFVSDGRARGFSSAADGCCCSSTNGVGDSSVRK